jgi:hypothetical protein
MANNQLLCGTGIAAALLGCTTQGVRRLAQVGRLPRLPGHSGYVFRVADVVKVQTDRGRMVRRRGRPTIHESLERMVKEMGT